MLTARRLNDLRAPGDAAAMQAFGHSGSGINVSPFPGGTVSKVPVVSRLMLYELTEQLTYPTDTKSAPFADDCAPVIHDLHQNQELLAEDTLDQTIYHPNALRDVDDNYIGLPLYNTGIRVWTYPNHQSYQLEIIENERNFVYWGKLNGSLAPEGTAEVSVYSSIGAPLGALADTGVDVTAWAPPVLIGGGLDTNDWVSITWFPDERRWYVTSAPCA